MAKQHTWPAPPEQGPLVECPCCRYPLLEEAAAYEICPLGWWEDDGQDNEDADMVEGGVNYDYSLTEARENFQHYLTQYRPSDRKFTEFRQADPGLLACKRRIIEAFEEMRNRKDDESITHLWKVVSSELPRIRRIEGLR